MKILKIHFKNIHSLKGEHTIDFDSPPIAGSILYAITGPTGAGKSTILDILTLALFNRIPRFDKRITTTEIENLGSVVTQYTDHAFAEVEYLTNNVIYRSTWRISSTKKGNLKDYEMSLATVHDGQLIVDKNSEVPAKNEEIIGLSYEQFIRSVLLSQGEFAKFLKSNHSEKTALLEDITGNKVYRQLGKKAFETAKEKKSEIDLLEQQYKNFVILTDEEVLNMKTSIIDQQEKQTLIQKQIDQNKALIQKHENHIKISAQIKKIKDQLATIEQQIEAFKPNINRLNTHQKLQTYQTDMTLWKNNTVKIQELEAKIETLIQEQKTQEQEIGKGLEQIKHLTGKKVSTINFQEVLKDFEITIVNILDQINDLKLEGQEARKDLNYHFDQYDLTEINHLKNLKSSGDQKAYASEVLNTLTNRVKISLSNQEIKNTIEVNHNLLISLEKEILNSQLVIKLTNEQKSLEEKEILLITEIKNTKNKTAEIENKISTIKPKINDLEIQKAHQYKTINLENERKALVDGDPCPLCGSVHHPYNHERQFVELGQLEHTLIALKQELEVLQASYTNENKLISGLEEKQSNTNERIRQIQFELENLKAATFKTNQEIKTIDELQHEKHTLESAQNELKQEEQARILTIAVSQILKSLELLTIKWQQYTEAQQALKKLYTGEDIRKDINSIQDKFNIVLQNKQKNTNTQEIHQIELKKINAEVNIKTEFLLGRLNALGFTTVESAISCLLSEQQVNQIIQQKETLEKNRIELQQTLKNLDLQLSEFNLEVSENINLDELATLITTLNKEREHALKAIGEWQNMLKNDAETKEKRNAMAKIIEQKHKDYEPWFVLEKLIGDATGNKYAKFAHSISLKYLIQLTNRRLQKLNDRYLIEQTDLESEMNVIDLYQGNFKRSVKTLSGGESFIVSLGLALGLSDMASKNIRLDSLFIDEGFGTLDPETLDMAIETLEKLQSESHRSIGIISHIDSMKERITTQIRIHKTSSGYSNIEVKG